MKKILKLSLYSMITFTFIMFCGCSNENKKLAKNLDNTVTNLVYSVTNLDFLSSSDLQSFSNNNDDSTLNIEQFTENNTSKNANCYENCENCYTNSQNSTYDEYYRLPENSKSISNSKKEFSSKPTKTLSSNKTKSVNAELSENKKNVVSFSTTSIETKNQELQELISTLINKRSTLLLYINDLYKGNISIESDHKNAINAYMNILKDNTSYFNNQKGMVSNQISQAKQAIEKDESSALANAYIIRTDEAISTRIAKLESSISAIDSILSILKNNENSSSKSYIANNYDENISKQDSTNNDEQLQNYSNNNQTNQISFPQNLGLDSTNINTENNINEQNKITNYPPRFPMNPPNFPPHRPEFLDNQDQSILQYQNNTQNQVDRQNSNNDCFGEDCENIKNSRQISQSKINETNNINSSTNSKNELFLNNTQNETNTSLNNKNILISENKTTNENSTKQSSNKSISDFSNTKDNECLDCENCSTLKLDEEKKEFKSSTQNKQNQTEIKINEPNQKLRETQQEIEKNKDKFDRVLKQEKNNNKLSLSFLEDKTKKDKRLKTITR